MNGQMYKQMEGDGRIGGGMERLMKKGRKEQTFELQRTAMYLSYNGRTTIANCTL